MRARTSLREQPVEAIARNAREPAPACTGPTYPLIWYGWRTSPPLEVRKSIERTLSDRVLASERVYFSVRPAGDVLRQTRRTVRLAR